MKDSVHEAMKEPSGYKIPVYRILLVKEAEALAYPITCAQDVARQMTDVAQSDREIFVCLFLNTKNRPTGRQTISAGTLNSSLVTPREVFKGAFLRNAASILLVHNHPSGDPTPSREDDAITKRLARVGDFHGVPLLDHVIVCPDGNFFSYQETKAVFLKGE